MSPFQVACSPVTFIVVVHMEPPQQPLGEPVNSGLLAICSRARAHESKLRAVALILQFWPTCLSVLQRRAAPLPALAYPLITCP